MPSERAENVIAGTCLLLGICGFLTYLVASSGPSPPEVETTERTTPAWNPTALERMAVATDYTDAE